ncbi:unnamed protein product [Paramecium primaurelia]|uniref:Uncharacterized protein n=1 Tax=Paramecium primaurelia TaxID=5886 RepID=A0A8S1PKH6_PARPR|nr:unnamed protein product [Paramecium primaurelia]
MIDTHLRCLFDGHEYSPILGCCRCLTCKNLKPYCQYCVIDFHAEHLKQLQPWSKISEWVQQKIVSYKNITKQMREIKILSQNLDDLIYPLYINQDINLTYVNLTNLNLLIMKLMKIDMIELQILPKLNELMPSIELLIKQIKTFDSIILQDNHLQTFIALFEQQEIKKAQESIPQEINSNNKTQQKLEFRNTIEKLKIHFTKQTIIKNKKIKVENNGKTIKSGPDCSGLIICEPEIPTDIISKFAFQIQKHKWVCIGVCHKSIIQKQKNDLNLTKIGHGTYMIENSGSTYSHLDKEVNNTEHTFRFSNNDIILIEIYMNDRKIIWKKYQSNQILWKMNLDTTLDLYPCVHIFNSKVAIIDEY